MPDKVTGTLISGGNVQKPALYSRFCRHQKLGEEIACFHQHRNTMDTSVHGVKADKVR